MNKEWKCEDCCCFGTDACHFPSMEAHYIACEHLVVDHDKAYQQGRADGFQQGVDDTTKRYKDSYMARDVEQIRADAIDEYKTKVTNTLIEVLENIKKNPKMNGEERHIICASRMMHDILEDTAMEMKEK